MHNTINIRTELESAHKRLHAAEARLRWRDEDTGTTHYDGCWRDHYACAMARIAELEADAERERIRLAACGVAALGYHKDGDNIHPDYESASLSDVHRLTAKLERAEAERDALRANAERIRDWVCETKGNIIGVGFFDLVRMLNAPRKEKP